MLYTDADVVLEQSNVTVIGQKKTGCGVSFLQRLYVACERSLMGKYWWFTIKRHIQHLKTGISTGCSLCRWTEPVWGVLFSELELGQLRDIQAGIFSERYKDSGNVKEALCTFASMLPDTAMWEEPLVVL